MNTQIILKYTVKCESYAQGNNCPGVTKFTNLITQGTAGRIYSDIHIHATFIKHTHAIGYHIVINFLYCSPM